jgi:serine protease Do
MTSRTFWIALIILLPFLGGGILGYSLGHSSDQRLPASPVEQYAGAPFQEAQTASYTPQQQDSASASIGTSRRNAITRTVATVSPAVVGINVIEVQEYRDPWGGVFGDDPFFRQFFGDRTYTQQVQGLGSGFIISPDGYILTNDHVAGRAKEITVTMTNGEKYKARRVGTDLVSDIALLKIDEQNLPYITLGNSDDVITGEWVIAFGNPFGLFDISDKPTVTVGVVSATKMNIRVQEGRVYRGMIQTDASINSGNSGGPLVNSLGEVIGVNAVIFTPNQGSIGLGFAIPINRVKTIVAELKRSGKIEREYWTGLEIQTVDRRVARYFGLDKVEGVIISDVKRGSPAERSGFKVGDIILEVNGEKVIDESAMVAIVDEARIGDTLRMKVFREKNTLELKLKLEKRST